LVKVCNCSTNRVPACLPACPLCAISFSLWPLLQHSRTWDVVSACVSTRRKRNFSIFCNQIICTSAELCFSSVNCSVIYSCEVGISSKRIILYITSAFGVPFVKIKSILVFCTSVLFLQATLTRTTAPHPNTSTMKQCNCPLKYVAVM
jgi:hypothetical protein